MDLDMYFSFGLNHSIQRNATFYDDKQLLFAAGQTCVLFHLDTKLQRRLSIVDGPDITSVSRCGMHIALTIKGRPPVLCLYNPASETKRMYTGDPNLDYDDFVCTAVSSSRKFIAAQGNGPDWPLVIWMAVSREVLVTLRPTIGREGCLAHDISFFGGDRDEIVVVGQNVFRLFENQPVAAEGDCPFVEVLFEKYESKDEYFSTAWPQKENLAVGTKSGKIMFFRGIEFIKELNVVEDTTEALGGEEVEFGLHEDGPVTHVACGPDALVCVFGEIAVVVYMGAELREYEFTTIVLMAELKTTVGLPGQLDIEEDRITHFDYWSATDSVMITTTNGQLMHAKLEEGKKIQYFESLLQRQHTDPILSMSVARGRPIVLTCSSHRVILWNLKTRRQEIIVAFKDRIQCAAIHPSGLYVAVGFALYTRICTVLRDGFRDYKKLDTKSCSRISISQGGHLIAFAVGTTLELYSFTTFERVAKLDGHADRIACVAWKDDDTRLASCDAKGVLVEWDVVERRKMWENTCITSYSHIAVETSGKGVIVVGSNRMLKCVENALVRWDATAENDLVTLVIYSDGKTLYTGATDGSIGRYVLPDLGNSSDMKAHKGEISEMAFSQDYRTLLTTAVDGLLFCWKTGGEIGAEELPIAFVEVLELAKQRERSQLLQMSIRQCHVAYECDLKLSELNHTETMRRSHEKHEKEVVALNDEIADSKEAVQKTLFESSGDSEELKRLRDLKRKQLFEQLEELDAAYRNTTESTERNAAMAEEIEEKLAALDLESAQAWKQEIEKEETMLSMTKILRERIAAQTEATQMERVELEKRRREAQEEAEAIVQDSKQKETDKHQAEKEELEAMETDIKRIRYLTFLVHEDVERKRLINSGKTVREIKETSSRIEVLKEDLRKLEDSLRHRNKVIVGQECKYFDARDRVGKLRRRRVISKHNIDELKADIDATEAETARCEKETERVEKLLPHLHETLRIVLDQCSTLETKLRDTLNGFNDKIRLLRSEESFVSKYKNLLHDSVSKDCDGEDLKTRIVQLFSLSRRNPEDGEESKLIAEFGHQIRTLQTINKNIKKDPVKTMKDQAVAEFKLSKQNMKLLEEIHEVQEEQAQLRNLIFEMEVAAGMPVSSKAKITSAVNDLRDQIELIVTMRGRTEGSKENEREIGRLDEVIDVQQKEMKRLKLLLAPKLMKKHGRQLIQRAKKGSEKDSPEYGD